MTIQVVPNPIFLSFHRWASELCHQEPTVPTPPIDERGWRGWARQFLFLNLTNTPVPDPERFPDWKSWANEVKTSLNA